MDIVIFVVVGVVLLALFGRAVFLLVRGVREGWVAGGVTGRGGTSGGAREPRLQIGRVRLGFLSLLLIGILVGAWQQGTFDKALHHVGLNARDCATNAFGATFCGDDLEAYERRFTPSYGAGSTAQSYARCRDEWLDLGATFAEVETYCGDLR